MPSDADIRLLAQDKYDGDASLVTEEDTARLESGEPLAYVIGWIPFLDLKIGLASKPLIPRPETEWWTELLIERLQERFGDSPFTLLDLCAGSGAIGLSILSAFPNARVSFSELAPEHCEQIRENIELNGLDASRADVRESDLFGAFARESWDVIATNPPYIPEDRSLDASVTKFEPAEALFAGSDGLDLIWIMAGAARNYMNADGELWLEADIDNVDEAAVLMAQGGAEHTELHNDLYGRPRLVVSYY